MYRRLLLGPSLPSLPYLQSWAWTTMLGLFSSTVGNTILDICTPAGVTNTACPEAKLHSEDSTDITPVGCRTVPTPPACKKGYMWSKHQEDTTNAHRPLQG